MCDKICNIMHKNIFNMHLNVDCRRVCESKFKEKRKLEKLPQYWVTN